MAEMFPPESAAAALEPLLTEIETAAALRVTDRTIRTWAANGILHVVRIGGVKRYRASDIAALIGPSTDDDRSLSIREMRALAELEADLRWDELQRRREARDIAVVTASGWVRVARQILFMVFGVAALILGVAGHLDVLELLHEL
jgi:hypothetical protein